MTLEFICNGYNKKTYEETTYSIEISVEDDYPDYFNGLLRNGKLNASNSNETINIALRELSWFKNFIYKEVKELKEKHAYIYLIMLEWMTEDDNGIDDYLYKSYATAKEKYNRLIEEECNADISWVGSEVFDENGEVNEGYELDCTEETDEEQNLCWRVSDSNSDRRYSVITLTKVEIIGD